MQPHYSHAICVLRGATWHARNSTLGQWPQVRSSFQWGKRHPGIDFTWGPRCVIASSKGRRVKQGNNSELRWTPPPTPYGVSSWKSPTVSPRDTHGSHGQNITLKLLGDWSPRIRRTFRIFRIENNLRKQLRLVTFYVSDNYKMKDRNCVEISISHRKTVYLTVKEIWMYFIFLHYYIINYVNLLLKVRCSGSCDCR